MLATKKSTLPSLSIDLAIHLHYFIALQRVLKMVCQSKTDMSIMVLASKVVLSSPISPPCFFFSLICSASQSTYLPAQGIQHCPAAILCLAVTQWVPHHYPGLNQLAASSGCRPPAPMMRWNHPTLRTTHLASLCANPAAFWEL